MKRILPNPFEGEVSLNSLPIHSVRFLAVVSVFLLMLASCTKEPISKPSGESEGSLTEVHVRFDFSSVEIPLESTRAVTADNSSATRIAFAVFKNDEKVYECSQCKDEANFGTVAGLRLAPGDYKFVVVAHYANSKESKPATISSPTSAIITEEICREAYCTVQDVTIERNKWDNQNVSITVPLCVTKLRIKLLDPIPNEVKYIKMILNEGKPTASSFTFNPTTGTLSSDYSFSRTYEIKDEDLGKSDVQLNACAFLNEESKVANVQVVALGSDSTQLFSRKFESITFNKGKIRVLNFNLFTTSAPTTFTFGEWAEEEPITY